MVVHDLELEDLLEPKTVETLVRVEHPDVGTPATVASAPELESWWVPQSREHHGSDAVLASLASATAESAASLPPVTLINGSAADAQPSTLESWWVPGFAPGAHGTAATLAADIDDPHLSRASLEMVSTAAPDESRPSLRLVRSSTEHVPAPTGDHHDESPDSIAGRLEPTWSIEDAAADTTAREADPGHVQSSWTRPDVDPPNLISLPQPWWAAKPPESTSAPSASTEPPRLSAMAAETSVRPPQAPETKQHSAAFDVRPAAMIPGEKPSAAPRPRPSATKVAGPTTRPSTTVVKGSSARPAFLEAALIAILVGTAFAAYGRLGAAPPPVPLARPEQREPAPLTAPAVSSPVTTATAPAPAPGARSRAPVPARPRVTNVSLATGDKPSSPRRSTEAQKTERSRKGDTPSAKMQAAQRSPAAKRTPARPVNNRPAAVVGESTPPATTFAPAAAATLPSRALIATASVPEASKVSPPEVRPASLEVFEMSNVDVRPAITHRVDAHYPDGIRERGTDDVVIVRVLVSPSGRAFDTQLLRRSKVHASLDEAALAAVKQWRFEPARKRDRAVACWLNVGVPFRVSRELASR
jgi:protein TonB